MSLNGYKGFSDRLKETNFRSVLLPAIVLFSGHSDSCSTSSGKGYTASPLQCQRSQHMIDDGNHTK